MDLVARVHAVRRQLVTARTAVARGLSTVWLVILVTAVAWLAVAPTLKDPRVVPSTTPIMWVEVSDRVPVGVVATYFDGGTSLRIQVSPPPEIDGSLTVRVLLTDGAQLQEPAKAESSASGAAYDLTVGRGSRQDVGDVQILQLGLGQRSDGLPADFSISGRLNADGFRTAGWQAWRLRTLELRPRCEEDTRSDLLVATVPPEVLPSHNYWFPRCPASPRAVSVNVDLADDDILQSSTPDPGAMADGNLAWTLDASAGNSSGPVGSAVPSSAVLVHLSGRQAESVRRALIAGALLGISGSLIAPLLASFAEVAVNRYVDDRSPTAEN